MCLQVGRRSATQQHSWVHAFYNISGCVIRTQMCSHIVCMLCTSRIVQLPHFGKFNLCTDVPRLHECSFFPPFVVVPTLTARMHTRKCGHVQFMRSAPCSRLFCLPTRLASLTQPSVRIKWPPRVAICTLCTQCVCVCLCVATVSVMPNNRTHRAPKNPTTGKSCALWCCCWATHQRRRRRRRRRRQPTHNRKPNERTSEPATYTPFVLSL